MPRKLVTLMYIEENQVHEWTDTLDVVEQLVKVLAPQTIYSVWWTGTDMRLWL
jgi:hypothetical protein